MMRHLFPLLCVSSAWLAGVGPHLATASEFHPTVRPGVIAAVLDQQITFQLELGRGWIGVNADRACFYFSAARSVAEIGHELATASRSARDVNTGSTPDAQWLVLPIPIEERLINSAQSVLSTVNTLCDTRHVLEPAQAIGVLDACVETRRAYALGVPLRSTEPAPFSHPLHAIIAAARRQLERHMVLTRSGTWATDYEPRLSLPTYCRNTLSVARGALGVLQGLSIHERLSGSQNTALDTREISLIDLGQELISRMCPITE